MDDLQGRLNAWHDETFPAATDASVLEHLKAEVRDELRVGCEAEEIADAAILLFQLAHKRGLSLRALVEAKHGKNLMRTWQPPNELGYQEHVKDPVEAAVERVGAPVPVIHSTPVRCGACRAVLGSSSGCPSCGAARRLRSTRESLRVLHLLEELQKMPLMAEVKLSGDSSVYGDGVTCFEPEEGPGVRGVTLHPYAGGECVVLWPDRDGWPE